MKRTRSSHDRNHIIHGPLRITRQQPLFLSLTLETLSRISSHHFFSSSSKEIERDPFVWQEPNLSQKSRFCFDLSLSFESQREDSYTYIYLYLYLCMYTVWFRIQGFQNSLNFLRSKKKSKNPVEPRRERKFQFQHLYTSFSLTYIIR